MLVSGINITIIQICIVVISFEELFDIPPFLIFCLHFVAKVDETAKQKGKDKVKSCPKSVPKLILNTLCFLSSYIELAYTCLYTSICIYSASILINDISYNASFKYQHIFNCLIDKYILTLSSILTLSCAPWARSRVAISTDLLEAALCRGVSPPYYQVW